MEHYKFFQNRDCEFFPCHQGIEEDIFNCIFCYCPLYALGEKCGGVFCYLENGIKDCSGCVRPHIRDDYDNILDCMDTVLELAKKNENSREKP